MTDSTSQPFKRIVIPTREPMLKLREALEEYRVPRASFEEVVRQCLDVYMSWNGDDEQILCLPYFNRIEVPAMVGLAYYEIYGDVAYHVQTFAREIYAILEQHGFFRKDDPRKNIDYAFECFAQHDLVLFHFNF